MDQDFRILTFEKLAELNKCAGPIADKVKQTIEAKPQQRDYAASGISLSYPGTTVIWPGPDAVHKDGTVNILFFFRGGSSSVMSKSSTNAIVVTADMGGVGGGASGKAYGSAEFVNKVVASILQQLKQKLHREDIKLGKLGMAGWSGGYDPIFGILNSSAHLVKQPDYVGVFDGMHHGQRGKPNESAMKTWQSLAQQAQKGKTQFVVTHTAVEPDNYASSTDTANWLVQNNGLQREPVQNWQGQGVRPTSVAKSGGFQVVQLYDKPAPYMKTDQTGKSKPNVPGTSGDQHIQALNSAPDYLPVWS